MNAVDSTCLTQQLERRDPTQEGEDKDEQMGDEETGEDSSDSESEDDDGADEEQDLELRSKIEEALRANGIEPADDSEGDGDSDEEVMDDDQMMAMDDKLAEIFRSRSGGGKGERSLVQSQFIPADSRSLQMQMPSARLPTSRTVFLTLWISTSRNSRPALISPSWFSLCSSLPPLPVQKKLNCLKRQLGSFARVLES